VIVGRVGAPFGVKGQVHVHSFTEPQENLIQFSEWYLNLRGAWQRMEVQSARVHGKSFVVTLEGCTDRDAAALLTHADIGIAREDLPVLPPDEYYWTELEGLEVYTDTGQCLGLIENLFETGSNDVIVVHNEQNEEYLIPYIDEVVLSIDLPQNRMIVHWDPEF
jgi:16S rRNA processing protein RimM